MDSQDDNSPYNYIVHFIYTARPFLSRFPEKTPKTKEAYLYRDLFSKHFGERNQNSIRTVEWQDSIACSSATALRWDASFQNRADASGRSVQGVHVDAYGEDRFDDNEADNSSR